MRTKRPWAGQPPPLARSMRSWRQRPLPPARILGECGCRRKRPLPRPARRSRSQRLWSAFRSPGGQSLARLATCVARRFHRGVLILSVPIRSASTSRSAQSAPRSHPTSAKTEEGANFESDPSLLCASLACDRRPPTRAKRKRIGRKGCAGSRRLSRPKGHLLSLLASDPKGAEG